MSHVNNVNFSESEFAFCFSTPQKTFLEAKTAFNKRIEHLQ